MFYETKNNDHGLAHNPFNSIIVPRPIGWISSQDKDGNINLAPYSYFNAVSDNPPMIMFSTVGSRSSGCSKDTLTNIEAQGEFVINLATYELRHAVNLSSLPIPKNENEFLLANLETLPSSLVKPPRVKGSPIHLECVYYKSIQLPVDQDNYTNRIVVGKVVGIHIDDQIIENGKVNLNKVKPIARLGYTEYAIIDNIFNMQRPD